MEKIFWKNEKLSFGGEIHYFRIEKKDWEDRLNKAVECGLEFISSYVPWSLHERSEGNFDFSTGNLKIRDFLDLCKKYNLKCVLKPGPYIMSEFVGHGLPLWLLENYSDIFAKSFDGNSHPVPVVSYLHPVFLQKVKIWYTAFFNEIKEYIDDGTIVALQLDNEVGMFHWITRVGDYSEITLEFFKKYLSESYSEKRLNELFGTSNFDEIIDKVKSGEEKSNIIYSDFMRFYYANYLEILKSFVNEKGINLPIFVNVHGFDQNDYAKRGVNFPIGVSQLLKSGKGKILTGDYYIGNIVHENFSDLVIANLVLESVLEGKPLTSLEFQSGFQIDRPKIMPSTLKLTSSLCVAMGMKMINYYVFAGGKNPEGFGLIDEVHDWQAPISPEGDLRKSYYVLKEFIKDIKKYGYELFNSTSVFDMYFGFIPSFFKTELLRNSKIKNHLERYRKRYMFEGLLRAFILENYKFSGLNLESDNFSEVIKQLDRDKPVIVYLAKYTPRRVQENIIKLIENGFDIILYPEIPVMNEFGEKCEILSDYLGIENVKTNGKVFTIAGEKVFSDFCETYKLHGDYKVIATNFENEIIGFLKSFNDSKVIVFGAGFGMENERKKFVCDEIYKFLGKTKILDVDSEGFVDVYLRKFENKCFLFIQNYDDYEKKVKIRFNDSKEFMSVIESRDAKIFVFEEGIKGE
ncbi:MAG: beta-galactosidase [Thermosipho sp. (in: Bacteria)]|nr:beta-galactosidase [Thermosipho sp. (in: thermotogales)]